MGVELKSLIRYSSLTIGLATTVACGILPGRDFDGLSPNSDGSSSDVGGGGAGDGSAGTAGVDSAGDGGASPAGGRVGDSGTGSEPANGGAAGQTNGSNGGAGSVVQIRFGAFTGLAAPGLSLGSVRVVGQFVAYGSASPPSASHVVVRGGFQ